MSIYTDFSCPVCGKKFLEEDDVVTCPDCGTPHHRECYKSLGHCFNEVKHNTDFSFDRKKLSSSKPVAEPAPEFENPFASQSFPKSMPNFVDLDFGASVETDKFNSNENIEGYAISDVVNATGPNFRKFLDKFKKNKKISWNWSAFIFGPYYLLYRKLIKEGAFSLIVENCLVVISQIIFKDGISKLSEYYQSILTNASTNADAYTEIANNSDAITKIINDYGLNKWIAIVGAIYLVVHIVTALLADFLVKKKVFKTIDSVEDDLKDDTTFEVNPFLTVKTDSNRPEDMRTYFLRAKGGTSMFIPLLAYCILQIISYFI